MAAAADSLVVEVLALAVDLVLQGEVEGDVLHLLLDEDLGARGVLLLLQVLDHVGEPHGQTVVAVRGRKKMGLFGGNSSRFICTQISHRSPVISVSQLLLPSTTEM